MRRVVLLCGHNQWRSGMTLDDQITFDDLDLDGPVPERSVELIHVRCNTNPLGC